MGRHGGGSRSSGSSRSSSRSGGGSRSSGSSRHSSNRPFSGSYNRSYTTRHNKRISYYTTDRNFGTRSGWNISTVVILVFLCIHMFIMLGGFLVDMIQIGGKVDGDYERIRIVDNMNLLTIDEENKTLELLDKVYDKSGMPITIVTTSFEWRSRFDSIEVYSEELYYAQGYDEDAMIILFTTNGETDSYKFDWEYDIYCGDDTIKCLSDSTFDKLISNFDKGMANQNLYEALEYSLNSVMDELTTTTIKWTMLPLLIPMCSIYVTIFMLVIRSVRKQNQAYSYFKEHPEKLQNTTMSIYSVCPACGAANTNGLDKCSYCNTMLIMSKDSTTYVR